MSSVIVQKKTAGFHAQCFSMFCELPSLGLTVLDEDHRIVFCNKWVCENTGISQDDLIGLQFSTLFREQDRWALDEAMEKQGIHDGLEVGLRAPNGRFKGVELSCVIRDGAELPKVVVTMQDISWHKDMECITRHAREKLGRIEEMVDCGIVVYGKENIIEFANAEANKILGGDGNFLQGKRIDELFEQRKWNSLKMLTNDLADDRYRCVKLSMRHRNGRAIPVQISLGRFQETLSRSQTYVVFRDLSNKIQIENQLRKTNKFLENVIDSSMDGIIAADISGNIIIFNQGSERMLGYNAREVVGKLHISKLYPPGMAKNIMRELRGNNHGEPGKLPSIPTVLIAKSGIRIPVNISAAIVYEDGKEIASVGIFTDLRERIEMQKQLDLTYQQLFQSDKLTSLGTLAAGVAHEINNPLNNISTTCQILLEELASQVSDIHLEHLQWIEEHVAKAADIVKTLLEFSREHEFRMQSTYFKDVVEDTLKLIKGEIPPHVDIEVFLQEGLKMDLDKTRMEQALMNLVLNAIYAMKTKGVLTIKAGVDSRSNLVEIIVKDTGTGIQSEHLPHIYDPFFTTKPVGKGTGLGLALTYDIIERHGGKISVRSRVGRGTQFLIELPQSTTS